MRFKSACMLAASIFAVSATAAYAQEVQEVIVTAQKREQNLQEVPITVTAATAETLEQAVVTSSRDLTLITPGLNFANNTAAGSPVIRGVATRGQGPGDEPSVPVYIDGVYQSTTHAGFFSFNNVERIEVLKGPQGTLFGRNALGGAINIITYQPSFQPVFKGDVSYGTDNEATVNGYVSGPITDSVAVNLAVHHDSHSGYIPNIDDGDDKADARSTGARAKLLWRLNDRIDLTVGANYMVSDDDSAFSGYPLDGNTIARQVDPDVLIAGPGQTAVGDSYFRMKQAGAYANLVWDFDSFQLTALTSWFDMESLLRTDSDISPLDYSYAKFPSFDTSYTTEVRLASTGVRKLDWLLGVNLFKDEGRYGITDEGDVFVSRSTPTGSTTALVSNIDTNAYALFAEATYHLNDALRVTGGVRYSYEDRSKELWRSSTPFASLPAVARTPDYDTKISDLNPLAYIGKSSRTYDKISWRGSVQYDFTDNAHGFFTFSQGFKSGFFNASTAAYPFVGLEPEEVNNYEIGIKTEPMPSLRFNVTAFYMEYTNLQVSARSPVAGSTTDVQNAAAATNYGGEVQVDWAPIEGLTIRAGLANQHARFDEFPLAQVYYAITTDDPGPANADVNFRDPCQPGRGTPRGGNRSANCDVSGGALAKSPDWTANLGVSYEFPAWGGTAEVGGLVYWSDNFFWDNGEILDNGGSYTTVNANASWTAPDDRTKITLFSRNLFDEDYPMNRYQGSAGTYAVDARGRTVGVRLGYKFP